MDFLITLACTTAACFLLRNPVKRFPVLFYVLAAALDMLFLVGCFGLLPWFAWSGLLVLMRRCLLAFSLFTVVMFVGVLPAGSKARAWLAPVRGELSLVACILAAGHVGFYVASYAPRMLAGGAQERAHPHGFDAVEAPPTTRVSLLPSGLRARGMLAPAGGPARRHGRPGEHRGVCRGGRRVPCPAPHEVRDGPAPCARCRAEGGHLGSSAACGWP